jgi:hypothetical protein
MSYMGTVSACPGSLPDLRQVNVTVSWERSGARSLQFVGYVARQE